MAQSNATRMMLAADVALTSPQWFEFRECSLVGTREFGATEGHRGTRQPASCRARVLKDLCQGTFSGRLNAAEIDWIMPRVFFAAAGATLIPGENASSSDAKFFAFVDKVVEFYLYNKIRVNQFTLSGSESNYLDWSFACVGELESSGGTWPVSPVAPSCGVALTFQDVVFTYSGTAYTPQSFTLTINNNLIPTIETSLTPTLYEAGNMEVSLDMTFDFRDATNSLSNNKTLYRAALAGAAASLAVNDGTNTYTFSFANLKIPDGAPTIPVEGRLSMPLKMMAYRSTNALAGATDHVVRLIKT